MTISRSFFIIAVILITAAAPTLKSQVTVGMDREPERAALLQLKTQDAAPTGITDDSNITSDKGGLLLPRVKLVNLQTMEPFIPTDDNDWLNNDKSKIKELHAGLMVYNLTGNADFQPGIYIWDGSRWTQSDAHTLTATNGLTQRGGEVMLGGKLDQPTVIDNDGHNLSLAGNGKLNVSSNAVFNGAIRIPDGAGNRKILMSDDDGNASWGTLSSTTASPKVIFSSDGVDIGTDDQSYVNTGTYIILPPGRWLVMVNMIAELSSNARDTDYWLRSTFVREGQNEPEDQFFEGKNSLVSGRVSGELSDISGFVMMKNETSAPVKFFYRAGKSDLITGKPVVGRITDYGSSKPLENSIVVLSLVD